MREAVSRARPAMRAISNWAKGGIDASGSTWNFPSQIGNRVQQTCCGVGGLQGEAPVRSRRREASSFANDNAKTACFLQIRWPRSFTLRRQRHHISRISPSRAAISPKTSPTPSSDTHHRLETLGTHFGQPVGEQKKGFPPVLFHHSPDQPDVFNAGRSPI